MCLNTTTENIFPFNQQNFSANLRDEDGFGVYGVLRQGRSTCKKREFSYDYEPKFLDFQHYLGFRIPLPR